MSHSNSNKLNNNNLKNSNKNLKVNDENNNNEKSSKLNTERSKKSELISLGDKNNIMTPNSLKKYENEEDFENEPKYNYNGDDKKLMRINSKGIIENIENILIEEPKPLKTTNKKKLNHNINDDSKKNIKNKGDNIYNNNEEDDLNDNRNKKYNKSLKLSNTGSININPKDKFENEDDELNLEEKINKFVNLIGGIHKEEFFNRIVLNYLYKENINLNDEELIALLKLGNNNTYQKILNKSLKLNLIKDDDREKNISFKDWVEKFIRNKNNIKQNTINNININGEDINNDYNNKKHARDSNKDDITNNIIYKSTKNKIGNNNLKISRKTIQSNSKRDIQINIIRYDEDEVNKNENKKFIKMPINNLDKKFINENTNEEIITLKKSNKKTFNNDYDDDDYYDDDELDYFKSKNKTGKITLRNKRDTSKDIIFPKNLNEAYNLIKNHSYKKSELHREFKDEIDKF